MSQQNFMSKIKGAFKSEKGSKVDYGGFHDSGSFDPYAPVNLGQGHDEDDEPLPQEPAQIEEEE